MSKEITPLVWEKIPTNFSETTLCRAFVPGGWLVSETFNSQSSLCFMPDVNHTWGEVSKPVTDNHDA